MDDKRPRQRHEKVHKECFHIYRLGIQTQLPLLDLADLFGILHHHECFHRYEFFLHYNTRSISKKRIQEKGLFDSTTSHLCFL